ncbi:T-cell surface antigen CD2-like isoform X2 [Simochromis diagramma]|uniref:T-cell surface antigen CD2-like isoform X2 n=1 Tax=Simochromis diagramma TaxID=43689 RepID=UPI001A7E7AFB|nr:T-cell surface antigen CD2-like isoform X2 [Simochromis diagramma]
MRRVKKMSSSSIITAVFLLCCLANGSTGSQDDCVYAATGSTFTVPLRYELKESDHLKWIKDTSVVFYRRQKQVTIGKNDDVDSTGSLKLTQLTKDKSGRYRPEVYTEGINVGGDLQSVRLCVLDRVQKPKVTVMCAGDKTNVSFTCNVIKSENNFQIKWFMGDKPVAEKETGKELTRPAEDVLNARFSCNVSNPVSSEISQPVQQECYKPSDHSGIWIAVEEEELRLQITQEQQQQL